MLITNLVISNITNRVNHSIIQATFTHASEPEDCRNFTMRIKSESATEHCIQFLVYNKRTERLEDVQSMYSEELIHDIMNQILSVSTIKSALLDSEAEAI